MSCICTWTGAFILLIILNLIFNWLRRKSKSDSLKLKHVVITGGSQGIGLAAGIIAAKKGAHVTILARNKTNLLSAKDEIKKHCMDSDKQTVNDIPVDVTKFNELEDTIKKIDENRPIDMLINCAGMAVCGKIEDIPEWDVQNQVNLNLLGTYFATKAVVPLMKSRKGGIILLVGSQASLTGIYGFGIYSATKFALRGLAEALYQEVLTYNVSVTLSLPPDTDTPGFERENQNKPKETKIISEAGGLFQPELVAKKMIDDALVRSG